MNLFQLNDAYGDSVGLISTNVEEEIIQRAWTEFCDAFDEMQDEEETKLDGDAEEMEMDVDDFVNFLSEGNVEAERVFYEEINP